MMGLLPVKSLEILRQVDLIYAPRSAESDSSVAVQALAGLDFPRERLREVIFRMDGDAAGRARDYEALAQELAAHGEAGKSVAYLTIGDAMTYSTLGYLVAALRRVAPWWTQHILPAPTSYATAAALTHFSLGIGKERVLILPCPEDKETLRADILSHDVVVLMKVGRRLPAVLALLNEMEIAQYCALAHRIGLDGEVILPSLAGIIPDKQGYLSVLLIRKKAIGERA